MKKSKLILLALLGLFFFNSCKDEAPEETKPIIPETPTIPTADDYKTITELKHLTGQRTEKVKEILEDWDYSLIEEVLDEDGVTTTLYFQSNSLQQQYYNLLEYNNKIFLCEFSQVDSKITTLNRFEKNSKEGNAYMTAKTFVYYGNAINTGDEHKSFTIHKEFINYFAANKANLSVCSESWNTTSEAFYNVYIGIDGSYQTNISYLNKEYASKKKFDEKSIMQNILSRNK